MKIRKISNRILAYTLTLAILLSSLVFGAVSVTAEDTEIAAWSGNAADSFAGGDGTAANPYKIENADQLFKVVEEYDTYAASYADNGQIHFILTEDIYINDVSDGTFVGNLPEKKNWLEKFEDTINNPSTDRAYTFNGCLDGDGHTIYGLYVNGVARAGLFPGISNKAVIKNLKIENACIKGGDGYAGAVVGLARWLNAAGTSTPAQITNVGVTNLTISDVGFAGGLVGNTTDATLTINNCYTNNISLSNWDGSGTPGGLVGADENSGALKINNSYSAGYFPMNSLENAAVCTNVYTNVPYPEGNTTATVTVLTDDKMKGAAAKTYMSGFDFAITWKTVENGYPVINTDIEIWDGTTAANYAGGTGTASDPWLIENGAQLLKMVTDSTADGKDAASVTNNYFKITADIYLNPVTAEDMVSPSVDSWAAKGYRNWDGGYRWKQNTGFCGNIDGDGHTIYGLYVESGNYSGFLANVIGHASVNNLHFKNAFVRGATNGCSPAVIIGAVNGNSTVRSTATVTNCTVDNGYVFSDHTGSWRNGIIVGGGFNEGQITVSNCAVTNSRGVITNTSTEKRTAAFIGNTNYTKTHLIQNCFTDSSMHPVTDATTEANYDVIHDNKIYKNVYTSAAKPSYDTNGDITYLTEEQMKGENAKTYMPGLSYKYIWEIVENGYPEINLRGEIWDGTNNLTDFSTFKGAGTHENPYKIENGNQLAFAVTKSGNELHYKLANDIVLNDTSIAGWEETANGWYQNTQYRFNGEMDGDGHTIEGLYWNAADTTKRYGLFAYCGKANNGTHIAVFKNITFTGASVNHSASTEGVAIVAGQASGETIFENIIIDETCNVNAPNVKGVAGIVGRGYNEETYAHITINNCAVLADITGKSHVGAFLGTFWDDYLTVTASNSFAVTNTGLIGSNDGTATCTNVYTTTVSAEDTGAVQVDEENMKGENAKTYMPGLDYDFLWKTVQNDYPVLRDMDDRLEAWDGTAATTLKGEGTKANPYKISNGAELYYAIVTYSNADVTVAPTEQKYFEITSDINLANKQWYVPGLTAWLDNVAYNNIGFTGVIYGNGHTIYNFNSNAASTAAGLIPVATQGTQIYDLHLVGGTLPRYNWRSYALGGFIGLAKGAAGSAPIIIDGCSVKNFDIAAVHGGGGFIGYSFSQSYNIKDSYVVNSTIVADEDKVTAGTANASAFVGFIDGSEINNSFAIENCYTDNLSAESAQKKESFAAAVSYKNVYTTNEAYDGSVEGLTKLDDAQMKAKLAGFNYNQVWQTVENGYSVHLDYAVQKEIFSGTEAASYAGGTGTEADPYLISDAQQLYKLANATREETLGKFYKLTKDITISRVYDGWSNDNLYTWAVKKAYLEGFTYASSFAGTLDGAGYTVSGIYYNNEITDNGDYAYGLIPFATANAVVKDITVSDINATVTGNGAAVGGVVGAAHVTPEDAENPLNFIQFVGVNVKNCSANAAYTGDIVGRATHGIKFEICNADSIIGNYTDNIFMNGCNEALTLGDNVVTYNALNADSKALEVIRAKLIGTTDAYITDINATYGFDIADLVSAYRNIVAAAEDEYELVWSQDFNNNTMDYSVWSKNTTMSRKTNLVYGDNATVNGGSLKLNNKDTGEVDENGNKIYSVSYGLSTVDTMSFKYGRLEMRAKIPFGAGAFPSLWLTSRNALGNGVSPYGYDNEIDIFEVFGKSTSQDRMITCMHKWYVDENGNRIKDAEGNSIECSNGTGVFSGNGSKIDEADRSHIVTEAGKTAWHTIVFEWTEDTMTFTVDGESYDIKLSQLGDFDLTDYDTDSEGLFNQFMYLRLNNHMYTVGGSTYVYGGSESDIDPNKLTYEIDYIKLYQKDNGEINLK